jgi:caa(3)-type oxidase subunit IV
MADTPEEIQKSIKWYFAIGLGLILATIITWALSLVEFSTHGINILIGLLVAAIKVTFVGLFFMHLKSERALIYKVLAFTVVFVLALFLLTYWSHEDPLVWSGF